MRTRAGAAAAVTILCTAFAAVAAAGPARATGPGVPALDHGFVPGTLLVSESFYQGNPGIVAGQTQLPPGCTTGCVTATANGSYPRCSTTTWRTPASGSPRGSSWAR
jgi:hypothetical protein